jgi:hypothetical protein
MAIFCLTCIKKHPERECPLNSIEECAIYEINHATSSCPSLSSLKAVFQGMGKDMEQLYLMWSRKPWKPRPPMGNQGMYSDPSQYFNNSNMNPHSMPYPSMWPKYQFPLWQQWNPQASSSSPWAPTWRGSPPGKFPQSMPQQQLQLPSNVPPGNQPDLNPNNKGVHQTDSLNLPSYSISTAKLYEMNLQSGRTVDAQPPLVTIE